MEGLASEAVLRQRHPVGGVSQADLTALGKAAPTGLGVIRSADEAHHVVTAAQERGYRGAPDGPGGT